MSSLPTFLQRIAAGDSLAIEACLAKYRALVWSIARQFAGHHDDLDDAVQEIFIELWRHAGRFDPTRASETTFIGMIARRRLIDRRRRRAHRPETPLVNAELIAARPSESDRREAIDEGQRARAFLEQLRPEQRRVLKMSFDEGMTQQEIAAATSQPLGTVKTHARRGLMRLRQLLDDTAARANEVKDQV